MLDVVDIELVLDNFTHALFGVFELVWFFSWL